VRWLQAGQRIQWEWDRPGTQAEIVSSRSPTSARDARLRTLHAEQSTIAVPKRRGPVENNASRPARSGPGCSESGAAPTGVSLGAGQVDGGGQQVHGAVPEHHIGGLGPPQHDIVHRQLQLFGIDPGRPGKRRLRVEVHDEHPHAEFSQRTPNECTDVVLATPPFWLATAVTVAIH
jgi:hypothetical protein